MFFFSFKKQQDTYIALRERLLEEGLYGQTGFTMTSSDIYEIPKWKHYWMYMKGLFKNMTTPKS